MFRIIITILFLSVSLTAAAQRVSVEEYIEQFKDIAINEMKRSGVPASITLAQGILESESGNSELVKRSNNHFGIKCKSTWSGETVTHDDDATGECFRAYTNANDSYRDHSDFLRGNKRYGSLFSLDPTDYTGWARGLKKAGYATNPRYPDLLIKYIEQYDLQQYSLIALDQLPKTDVAKNEDGKKNIDPVAILNEIANNTNENAAIEAAAGKIITVNNIKCVYVKKGTSLLLIANKNNISLNKLMDYNDMTEEGLLGRDQFVFLHKKAKTGEIEYHIVLPGETMYDVAQKNGIQLKYLVEYNDLHEGAGITPGTKLFLQPGVRPVSINSEPAKKHVHVVAPKQGLYAIARMYNVTVQQLKTWNKLDSEDLKIGQQIIVSK